MDSSTQADAPRAPLSHSDIRSVLFGIMLALFLAALDQTIVATALPTIGRELNDVTHLPWIVTAYLLAATAVTPLYGKLADIHGRRTMLLVGLGVFIIGSIACALAPTLWALVAGRFVQGLGGGGLIALVQTIVADMVAPKERGRYQAYIASMFFAASLLGPVLGGTIADALSWPVIFWINIPLGFVAYAMSSKALKKLPRNEKPHKLDILGSVLMTAATVTLLLALSWGGTSYPWLSAPVLGLIAASAVLWVVFSWWLRRAAEPLIPLALLANPVVRMSTLAACFGMGTYIGLTIYLPVYFETIIGLTPSGSGLALLPLSCATVFGAMTSARSMARLVHYKRVPMAGLTVAVIGTAILVVFTGRIALVPLCALLAMISVGLGTLLPVATVSVQNAVAPHQIGTVTGVANFFRQIGGALIVALLGAIILGGLAGPGETISPSALTKGGVDQATMVGLFRWVFGAILAGFALSLFFLARMKELPLRSGKVSPAEAAAAE